TYASGAGHLVRANAVAWYLRRRFALPPAPVLEILPCQGAKEALFHLPLAALDPARPLCWYPDPAYPVYERAILFAGATPRRLPLRAGRAFLPDLDVVPAADWRRTSIVYDNYPHNPTGAGAPRAHHQKLAALAKEHGFLLVCDEPYVDLYVHEPPHPALQVAREHGRVLPPGPRPSRRDRRVLLGPARLARHPGRPRPQLRSLRSRLHPPGHGPHPGRLQESSRRLADLIGLPAFRAESTEGAERAEL